jgi:hypothetical protein
MLIENTMITVKLVHKVLGHLFIFQINRGIKEAQVAEYNKKLKEFLATIEGSKAEDFYITSK